MKVAIVSLLALWFSLTASAQKTVYVINEPTKEVAIYHNDSMVPAEVFTQWENPILYAFVAKMQIIVIDYSRKEDKDKTAIN